MNPSWKLTSLLAALGAIGACNTKGSENLHHDPVVIPPTPGPQPVFPKAAAPASPPPPISGGTLTVAEDGRTVIAADPDRDLVYVVDIPTRTLRHTIRLARGSEPG